MIRLTVGVADNVCFWVGFPQDPVTPGWNIRPHLGSDRNVKKETQQNYQDD